MKNMLTVTAFLLLLAVTTQGDNRSMLLPH
jgi:hypothetical protein